MTEQTPLDNVWLSLLIGCFDLDNGGLAQLRSTLEDVGLSANRSRLRDDGDNHKEDTTSDDVAQRVADECAKQGDNSRGAFQIGAYDSTALINSMKPGVWSHVPEQAANGLIVAEESIREGRYNAGARLLVGVVETMTNHCYMRVHPPHGEHVTWSEIENVLLKLDNSELLPTLLFVKCFRRDYYNRTASGEKAYNAIEMAGLWHMALYAVTRMAGALERRTTLPVRE